MKKVLILIIVMFLVLLGGCTLTDNTDIDMSTVLEPEPIEVSSFDIVDYKIWLEGSSPKEVMGREINLGPNVTSEQALEHAEDIIKEVFGVDTVSAHKPFMVYYDEHNKLWMVTGKFVDEINTTPDGKTIIEVTLGGRPHVVINQLSGEVIAVWHDE
ncbi:MAG: hypothetical protein HN948_07175 [Clostridia bacterium]|nr:hypothetical protein [Clostridia bacterium]